MWRAILKDRSFRVSILLTLIFFGTGIACLYAGVVYMSWTLFVLLPIVLGLSIGALPNRKWANIAVIITTIFGLACLLFLGLSGFICIVMALPIVLFFVFLGSALIHLTGRYREIADKRGIPFLLLPLIPFLIAAATEKTLVADHKQVVEVRTERVFDYSSMQVYDAIKSVDTLVAEKPFLMYLDLPIPTRCVLQKEEVGGIRTCYFKKGNFSNGEFGSGTITEKITALQRGKLLKMDVTRYDLVGRKWLGFKEAIYYFDSLSDGRCELTRVTTYTSELSPRFYWEPIEKLSIRQEHDYVFNNLAKDLKERFGR